MLRKISCWCCLVFKRKSKTRHLDFQIEEEEIMADLLLNQR